MSTEHQKYIREVFPRLIIEVQARNWLTADEYIDSMIQYQCQFSVNRQSSHPSSSIIFGIIIAIAIFLLTWLVWLIPGIKRVL